MAQYALGRKIQDEIIRRKIMKISGLMKRKNALPLALVVAIFGFSIYGIYHTAYAYHDLRQPQNNGYAPVTNPSSDTDSPLPGSTLCNPYGCAGCSGCVSLQYQENIEALPSSTTQIEQIY